MTKTHEIAKTAPVVVVDPTTGAVDLTKMHEATREIPAAVPLPAPAKKAWQSLPQVYGTVRVPEPGTDVWSPAELANAGHALEIARQLRDAAKTIETAVTQGRLTDLDMRLVLRTAGDPNLAANLAKMPRTNDGKHYVLGAPGAPVQTPIPGTDKVLSVEYRKLGGEQLSMESLQALRKAGEVSGREFRRLTRTVRVIDPEALTRATAKDLGLRARLRKAFAAPRLTVSVHVRPAKTTTA